jgi:hypothetical protein
MGCYSTSSIFYKYGTPMGCNFTSLIFYKYGTPMGCYSTSSIFIKYSTSIGAGCVQKLLLKPSSTGSSRRDEIFVNKTIISSPPCRGGMLNPDCALGIKELVNLLTNPSDRHGLTLFDQLRPLTVASICANFVAFISALNASVWASNVKKASSFAWYA